jgi:16S rRNA (cytosine967-C5)-methyltransferase
MSRAGSQQRTLLALLAQLQPHWRRDRALPARIQTLLARNRAFGSRDRRLYRELIYTTLRYLPWVEPWLARDADRAVQLIVWLAQDEPATAGLRAELLPGWPAAPGPAPRRAATLSTASPVAGAGSGFLVDDLLPAWVDRECPAARREPMLDALLARAPLWLRRREPDDVAVLDELRTRGWTATPAEVYPIAVQIREPIDVTATEAYRSGRIEIQDLGSQLVLASTAVPPGSRWLDACAGAGGKTLQLADLVGSDGHVDAYDVRPGALAELATRADRARVRHVTVHSTPPTGAYDGVLVDAPCTGSGTWRRAPHLKWTTAAAEIGAAAATQFQLLDQFSARVRPGGQLVYATCSLCTTENESVVAAFLAAHPGFAHERPQNDFGFTANEHGLPIRPGRLDSDGFFVAHLRRQG